MISSSGQLPPIDPNQRSFKQSPAKKGPGFIEEVANSDEDKNDDAEYL